MICSDWVRLMGQSNARVRRVPLAEFRFLNCRRSRSFPMTSRTGRLRPGAAFAQDDAIAVRVHANLVAGTMPPNLSPLRVSATMTARVSHPDLRRSTYGVEATHWRTKISEILRPSSWMTGVC